MEKKKYLDFYKQYYDLELPCNGLCTCFIRDNLLELMRPTTEDILVLYDDCDNITYWGSGKVIDSYEARYKFTELRQTIVLFMAAMNNEL